MSSELRHIHAETLLDLAREHQDLRVLEADLMGSVSTGKFQAEFPEQFIQCGIAEANMIGVAAGLSATGLVPFVHSFGCFITRRCYDQLFLSGGYARQHINIFGSDAGVAAVTNGGTHMPFEDVGLMRLIPNSVVIEVSDAAVLKKAMHFSYQTPGVNYIRSTRKDLPDLYKSPDDIEIGKGQVLREGDDLTIVASGLSVHDALKSATEIEALMGKTVTVVDMHTIKPLDTQLVIQCINRTGKLLTVENHNVTGGLGDAVIAELLEAGVAPTAFRKLGVREQFGQVGSLDYLKDQYGISAQAITEAAIAMLD
ncbi:transketolase family protein [Endozoicomonas numazuensis]|uniref:Transketolase n=1 Tax=Endozoicomonas numazuensis TaxID=1137799 RepID=A0A081NGP2_9GAMM|nr:transketolase C-terminal domain-containing protein [Endozoicomonas numazuensis]KEQ17615.1 transketolase [Endozoicomonas numazuensis]